MIRRWEENDKEMRGNDKGTDKEMKVNLKER